MNSQLQIFAGFSFNQRAELIRKLQAVNVYLHFSQVLKNLIHFAVYFARRRWRGTSMRKDPGFIKFENAATKLSESSL